MTDYFAGIDIGSTMTKVAIMDRDSIVASFIGPTGAEHRKLANEVMQIALTKAKISLDDLSYIVATGYGRINVPFADKQITEISCHARGVTHLFKTAKTIVDIGGQDSKVIRIENGQVSDFVMNDKCAAGTGRFLEVIADVLGLDIEEMGKLSLTSKKPSAISSICTIFAEQEVVDQLSKGVSLNDLVAGIHESMAIRIFRMANRIKIVREVVVTGGGAKNPGLVKALSNRFGHTVLVPPEPLLTGAIGAALKGKDLIDKQIRKGVTIDKSHRRLEEVTFFEK